MPKYAGGRKGGRTDSEKEGGKGLKIVSLGLKELLTFSTLYQTRLPRVGRIHAKGERGTGRRVDRPEDENGVTKMVEECLSPDAPGRLCHFVPFQPDLINEINKDWFRL